jgi:hypothetical protein
MPKRWPPRTERMRRNRRLYHPVRALSDNGLLQTRVMQQDCDENAAKQSGTGWLTPKSAVGEEYVVNQTGVRAAAPRAMRGIPGRAWEHLLLRFSGPEV